MKILICGAGTIADELLKRIGPNWEITLIEKDRARLEPFPERFPNVTHTMAEDASSPVALKRAGLAHQDCVLAMTNDDHVNLAVARFAREANVNNILAVVRDSEMLPDFRRLDVWTIAMSADTARKAYQFLKDPRVRIIDLGEGEGELLELLVGANDVARFRETPSRKSSEWRVVGAVRQNELIFPEDISNVKLGDRLLILGRSDLFSTFSNRFVENPTHFPRTYGSVMVLGIGADSSLDVTKLLNEALYIARGTHTEQIKTLCENMCADIRETVSPWSESLQIEMLEAEGNLRESSVAIAQKTDVGLVVLPYVEGSFLQLILGNEYVKTARKLPCPLLLAKFTEPYENILVPYNGSLGDQRALEIALDFSRQIGANVSVLIVQEPSYLQNESSFAEESESSILKQVRDLSRVYGATVKEHVRHGNPVKEILAVADEFQLLVMGADDKGSGLFSLDVEGMIVDKSSCSVLLVT
jgi:Trk K+ transport system NAD-binding subunit/nucleotide-binding universal stress UspA family protein